MAKRDNDKLYWASLPFQYGLLRNETSLDRGQIITLARLPNDEKLTRLGYLLEVEAGIDPAQCPDCGAEFIDFATRAAHVKKRHVAHDLNPLQEDSALDREYQIAQQTAPLRLDKTLASQRG